MKSFSLIVKILFVPLVFMVLQFQSCRSEEDDDPVVTANEELYINELYASGDDWIELFNNSPAAIRLDGYKIYDDPANKYVLPPGTTIPANDFLIIFANDLNTGLNTSFKLTSGGETVYLENARGEVIDKVVFPALLNNQSYARIPDGSTTFEITGFPTQGEPNQKAPSIVEVRRLPLVPGLNDAVTVSTEFSTSGGISEVILHYRFNGSDFTAVPMSLSAGVHSGTIPAMGQTGAVDYYIEAKGSSGSSSFRPASAPANTYTYLLNTDPLPNLRINEFLALNTSCCTDEMGEYEDWIEIHNLSDAPINLAGYYLSDDPSNPFNSRIRDTNAQETTIPAGGYIVIWADGDRDQGERHVDFRLSQAGESVVLFYIDGRKIDEYTFGVQTEDKSMGRLPNGTGPFQVLSSPTPGAPNQ
jgi:hypothetical protein